jgi:hypothetical protein
MLPFESRVVGDRTMSSAWTFCYKFIAPALWVAAIAVASVWTFTNVRVEVALAVVWAVAGVALLRVCVPLKRVSLEDDALLVSNFRTEWRISYALIAEVTQNRWIKLRPITIRLTRDVGCGEQIVFMPYVRMRWRFLQEDPEVDELRTLARVHPSLFQGQRP